MSRHGFVARHGRVTPRKNDIGDVGKGGDEVEVATSREKVIGPIVLVHSTGLSSLQDELDRKG